VHNWQQWWWFAPYGQWVGSGAGVQALRVGPSQGAAMPWREIPPSQSPIQPLANWQQGGFTLTLIFCSAPDFPANRAPLEIASRQGW